MLRSLGYFYTTTTTAATAGQGTDSAVTDSAVRKERAETMQYTMLSWLLLHNNKNNNSNSQTRHRQCSEEGEGRNNAVRYALLATFTQQQQLLDKAQTVQ